MSKHSRTPKDLDAIQQAISHLKQARGLLRAARSPRAADYVARALKSTHGALNNAWLHTPYEQAPTFPRSVTA